MPPPNPFPMIVGMLLGFLVGAMIGSLIGAILLRAAAKLVARMDIPFQEAFVTVFIAVIVNVLVGFPIGFVLGASGMEQSMIQVISLGMIPVGIAINAAIISSRHELSFSKGLKISGVMFLIYVVIVGVLLGVGIAVIRSSSPY